MLTLPGHCPRMCQALAPLLDLARTDGRFEASVVGTVATEPGPMPIPRFVFRGAAGDADPWRLALFALVHGDEAAGVGAITRLLWTVAREPGIAAGIHLFCYPVCNPTGAEDRTRHNRAGADLNREFWRDSNHPEVRALEAELRAHRFEGLIGLHADCDSPGLYAFARGSVIAEELVAPALAAAEGVLPRNTDVTIDGFTAEHGIIRDCYPGVLCAPPEQHPVPFEIILETPGPAPLDRQAEAACQALLGILGELPRLRSLAAGI